MRPAAPRLFRPGTLAALAPAVLLAACSSYRPRPITDAAVSEQLRPPESDAVLIASRELKHPMLRPISVDLRGPLSPEELGLLAVLVNPSLRAARDKRNLGAAQLVQAGLLPNPSFSGSIDFPVSGSTDGTVTGFGLGLTWDVSSVITRGAAVDAATAESASVALDVAWQEWQAAMGAKLHATRLVHLGDQLETARQTRADAQRAAELVREAGRKGLLTSLDLDAAEAALQKASLGELEIQSTMESERLALNLAVGLPAEMRVQVRAAQGTPPGVEPASLTPEEIARRLEAGRLDLVAMRMGYQSQEHKVRGAVLSQFPKVSVGLNHARDTGNVGTLGFGVDIELPIFDRGHGRIAIEEATREQLFDEYVSRTFEARSEVAALLSELGAVRRRIAATDGYVARLQALARSYDGAATAGGLDVLTVYEARATLAEARLDSDRLRQQQDELLIGLETALGRAPGEPQR
jgi:outer membrane protein TolC